MKWDALLCALSVVFLTAPAMSQEPCGDPMTFDRTLRDKYGETPAYQAFARDERALSFYVNPDTGTWTVLALYPERGMVCAVASGDGWETLPASLPGEPS